MAFLNQWINDKAFCRTALATPGLLITLLILARHKKIIRHKFIPIQGHMCVVSVRRLSKLILTIITMAKDNKKKCLITVQISMLLMF